MKVKIESVRDYELHIKNLVSKMSVSNKTKAIIRKTVMQTFHDGIAYKANSSCFVDIKE